jgi:hypothetical protein
MTEENLFDPYARCEEHGCTHDLSRGVTLEELLSGDGPYPTSVTPRVAPLLQVLMERRNDD